jgi:hypothetical protein
MDCYAANGANGKGLPILLGTISQTGGEASEATPHKEHSELGKLPASTLRIPSRFSAG